MAETVYGSIVGGYGRLWIRTTRTDSATSTNLKIEVGFASKYSVSDSGNTFYFDDLDKSGSATTSRAISAIKTTVDSGSGWSDSNSKVIYTVTKTYDRGTTDKTRYLYAKLAGVDRVGGTMYVSTTAVIPKVNSYTVTYNANGGTGAPSAQTKSYGTNLTLSSTKPTRTGYSFQGWATSSSGSVVYKAGASYSADQSVTLYAVWKANTYTVTYNANGGSGAPSNQTKTYGKELTLSSTKPTRANYTFKGWGTSTSATTISYAAGAKYTKNAAITLYAIWELSYAKPRITNFSVKRCDANSNVTDTGKYALVKFNWACDKTVTSIKIERKLTSEKTWPNYITISASGTSGSVSQRIGSGNINTDNTYDIRVTVADGTADTNKSTKTGTLAGTKFVIDLKAEGTGIAFGKPAEIDNYMDVGYKTRFRDAAVLDNAKSIRGRTNPDPDSSIPEDIRMLYVSTSNNTVLGYGSYENNLGSTAIYGNNVSIYSKGNITTNAPLHLTRTTDASGTANNNPALTIGPASGVHLEFDGNEIMAKETSTTTAALYINSDGGNVRLNDNKVGNTYVRGCQIAVNKVLWSGAHFMSSGQTANLEEKISEQATGIVLIWSYYDDGAAQNYAWNTTFIPKYLVSVASGTASASFLTTATANSVTPKYLYIYDNKITGYTNANNTDVGNDGIQRDTTSGITVTPRTFVLRYVIGV